MFTPTCCCKLSTCHLVYCPEYNTPLSHIFAMMCAGNKTACARLFQADPVTENIKRLRLIAMDQQRSTNPDLLEQRGRKTFPAFRLELLSQMVLVDMDREIVSQHEHADATPASMSQTQHAVMRMVANTIFTYHHVRRAAENLREEPHWSKEKGVQRLKFSQGWCKGWLDEFSFRRRRITAQMIGSSG